MWLSLGRWFNSGWSEFFINHYILIKVNNIINYKYHFLLSLRYNFIRVTSWNEGNENFFFKALQFYRLGASSSSEHNSLAQLFNSLSLYPITFANPSLQALSAFLIFLMR